MMHIVCRKDHFDQTSTLSARELSEREWSEGHAGNRCGVQEPDGFLKLKLPLAVGIDVGESSQ